MNCACHKIHDKKTLSRRDIAIGLATGSLALVTGCETNSETGRSQLAFIPDGQLAALSLSAWNDVKAKTKISTDTNARNRVASIGGKIAKIVNIPNATWEYEVFDTAEINAFVLPGGKVGVYRGLLDLVQNDAQLACVLGHETGHVTGRHASERMSQGVVAQLGMSAAQIGASKVAINPEAQKDLVTALGLGVQYGVLMPFSRNQESEADILGLHYMKNAGYDPRESIKLWERMAAAQKTRIPEFLSTHPSEETRIARLKAELVKMGYQV